MAVLPIRKYGDEVLRHPTEPVTDFGPELQTLIDDMVLTMYAAPGVGLAANQVGLSLNLVVIDLSVGQRSGGVHVLANAEILETRGEQTEEEGCLSIPDFVEVVHRPEFLRVQFQDRHGKFQELEAEGLMARAVNHEVDHLNGTLFIDHLRGLKKERILKKIQKVLRSGGW